LRKPTSFESYDADVQEKVYAAIFSMESTTTRAAGGLDFTARGGKRQGREVPQSLRVEPGAKRPVWKTQIRLGEYFGDVTYS
jgi:hypothetical protein